MAGGFFDRSAIVAPPGWSRWLVPPAALAVHLGIGQAYAWSVLKTGLSQGLGLSGTATALPFQLAIVMLGLSAAIVGTTVERRGPRWAMAVSTACFAAGFLISAGGIALDQYWLVVVGYGGVGGIGLGIGYISPVSTLIKWFVDRPGMATGIAIMGFGGGALIASPVESALLGAFGRTPGGLASTFAVMGVAYAIFMSLGWLLIRVPPEGWRPPGAPAESEDPAQQGPAVSVSKAVRLPQFWFLWIVLCFNVTAGIGILERADGIFRDFFRTTTAEQQLAAAAAAFVAILSLANMLGRFVWSSTSDLVGRKNIYRVYLGLGALLYLAILTLGEGNKVIFLIASLLILSFYGAGFATVPAYLKDLFGTYQVGAIHGRLLTAWSAAGVLGPLIVNAIVDASDAEGPAKYTTSFIIMTGLLAVGFVANELIRPVDPKHYVSDAERAAPEGSAAAEERRQGASR
ncbi:OFA family MFS transporter [Actinomycetospora cinnamomea]|uniref:Nitrate/nitrite transporter NarK n=1 Tax=Actinomycetospora cinnamomea TaxID=663609 RepID=A0A2U1EYH2_9PSEU|nr:OFA family MFS transporter [Actinomycetospora cinnamomea]PVZ04961.1 nitrate/nitrite transporter NarK [Actinomycetospora cinnamomea]